MRIILIPVADRPECANALRTAFEIGKKLDANLFGCHIRAHRESNVALPAGLGSLADATAWESAAKGKTTKKSSAAASALFSEVANRHDYPIIKRPKATSGAVWIEKVGSPSKVLSNLGPVSDLVIVSRPATKDGKLARLFLDAALLNTSRPVLVLPQSRTSAIGKRISIAWNQSAEAAQSVSAAMPMLRHAEQVNIITCGPESGVGPKSAQLANYLRFWGVKAERVKAPKAKNDAKALMAAYQETNSDLMVMGAYSHSRLRETMFGGVTEYMLNRANIPVLMLHT
jgi:hypothetical protein